MRPAAKPLDRSRAARGRALGLAAALMLPLAAQAACPERADLARGITLQGAYAGEAPINLVFHALSPEVVSYYEYEDGVLKYTGQLAWGLYDLSFVDYYAAGAPYQGSYNLRLPDGDLQAPVAGMEWSAPLRFTSLEEDLKQVMHHVARAGDVLVLEGCRYDTLEVKRRITGEGRQDVLYFTYLPALGISYLAAEDAGGVRRPLFAPRGISSGPGFVQ